MTNQEIYAQEVGEVLQTWMRYAEAALKANAKRKKVELSGEMIKSIKAELAELAPQMTAKVLMEFQMSGAFQDMRLWKYNQLPPVEKIEAWVRKVGLKRFARIPGYSTRSNRLPTTDLAIKRVAWGVAVSRLKKGQKKNRPWWSKLFYGPLMYRLTDDLIEKTGNASVRALDGLTAIK
jgi:hypothetical protein